MCVSYLFEAYSRQQAAYYEGNDRTLRTLGSTLNCGLIATSIDCGRATSRKRIRALLALLVAVSHRPVAALENGLGKLPRLAYSTWNFFGTHADEPAVRDTAAALERTGLKALGFDTINIDAGSVDRDPSTGKLVPSWRSAACPSALLVLCQ